MPVHVIIVYAIFGVAVLALTVEFAGNLEDGSRVETVPVVEKRLEAAIYTMSGVEEGSTTVKLGDEYGLEKEDEEVLINYSTSLTIKPVDEEERTLDTPVDFSVTDQGISDRFCISKSDQGVSIGTGAC